MTEELSEKVKAIIIVVLLSLLLVLFIVSRINWEEKFCEEKGYNEVDWKNTANFGASPHGAIINCQSCSDDICDRKTFTVKDKWYGKLGELES